MKLIILFASVSFSLSKCPIWTCSGLSDSENDNNYCLNYDNSSNEISIQKNPSCSSGNCYYIDIAQQVAQNASLLNATFYDQKCTTKVFNDYHQSNCVKLSVLMEICNAQKGNDKDDYQDQNNDTGKNNNTNNSNHTNSHNQTTNNQTDTNSNPNHNNTSQSNYTNANNLTQYNGSLDFRSLQQKKQLWSSCDNDEECESGKCYCVPSISTQGRCATSFSDYQVVLKAYNESSCQNDTALSCTFQELIYDGYYIQGWYALTGFRGALWTSLLHDDINCDQVIDNYKDIQSALKSLKFDQLFYYLPSEILISRYNQTEESINEKDDEEDDGISKGITALVIIVLLAFAITVVVFLYCRYCKKKKPQGQNQNFSSAVPGGQSGGLADLKDQSASWA